MHERRSEARRPTGRLQLARGLTAGRLINLGPNGFAIETERGLPIGEYFDFAIRSGPGKGRVRLERRFAGWVRWCALTLTIRRRDGEVVPVFRAGFARDPDPQGWSKGAASIDFSPPSA